LHSLKADRKRRDTEGKKGSFGCPFLLLANLFRLSVATW